MINVKSGEEIKIDIVTEEKEEDESSNCEHQ